MPFCDTGITVFSTNAETKDLPAHTTEWLYTTGYVLKRNSPGNTLTIILHGYMSNRTAIISHTNDQWTEWDIFVKNTDISELFIPMQGTASTFVIPSKTSTVVNRLSLNSGIYIVNAHALFTNQFDGNAVYTIALNESGVVTYRGTGIGGGGATPFTILTLTKTSEIQLVLYQDSLESQSISRNTLTATKISK